MKRKLVTICSVLLLLVVTAPSQARKKRGKKKKKENITKIISKKDFLKAVEKLAEDERVPVASSTLVEKGRGEDFYSVDKMLDEDPETFWAEGGKGWGKKAWVAFYVPEGTTHVEITPGAGKEQFENFNRPRQVFFDIYLIKIKKKDNGEKKTTFKWLGRTVFNFKDKPVPVRRKLKVKLPELVMAERTMYVGVLLFRKVYRGQFDDTAIATFRTHSLWGEQ
ncbi:MAG: hypothetical protein DRI34_04340 [Deltaproteobacteria bacterium]|nr:MAG: hypothetical protein DRI34_04340 [Deltaproteobacteria bacterium]